MSNAISLKAMNEILLPQTSSYCLKKDPVKGVGVYSLKDFKAGDIISKNYTAIIDWEMDESSPFQQTYPMYWTEEFSCIAFGIINLVNHSSNPNCRIAIDIDSRTIALVCKLNLNSGDEFTIDYGDDHYPFKYGNVKIH